MHYVIGRGIVMFGGQKQLAPNNGEKNDTWLFDGMGWAEIKPTTPPSARRSLVLASHPVTRRTMLFGGSTGGAETHVLDLGTFIGASYTPYGSGCVGSNGTPTLGANGCDAPYINAAFTAQLTNIPSGAGALLIFGSSNAMWGTVPLPMDWSIAGFTGCCLRASLVLFTPMNTAGTTATFAVTVPNNTSLAGLSYYNQAFVFDKLANPSGATFSNGAAVKIGRR